MKSKQKISPLYATLKVLFTPVFKALYFTSFKNKNNLPSSGRYIICANHTALKDPLLIALCLKRQVFFMAKAELFKNKLFSKLIYSLGAFPVNRGKQDMSSIAHAEQLLREGKVVGIFPEGTRSKTGELLRPKVGAAMIAYKTNTPIIPLAISSKNGKAPSLFNKVTVSVGAPMTPEDLGLLSGSNLEYRNASRKIMDEIGRLKAENK